MSKPLFTEREVRPRGEDAVEQAPPEDAGPGMDPSAPHEGKAAGKGEKPVEIGGPKGPDPTRYGDWELEGRCIDF